MAPTLDHFYQTLKAVKWKCQLSGVDPLRGHTAAILAKNVRRRGSRGQTGSRNMAATRFLDFLTPTSYSTPNTLGGLTRTVTELPGGNLSITPLLRPSDLEIFRISMTDSRFFSEIRPNFSRILTTRFRSRFLWRQSGRGSVDLCKKFRHTSS